MLLSGHSKAPLKFLSESFLIGLVWEEILYSSLHSPGQHIFVIAQSTRALEDLVWFERDRLTSNYDVSPFEINLTPLPRNGEWTATLKIIKLASFQDDLNIFRPVFENS